MELVQGETLAHRMAREGRLQAREGVRILRELLAALGHAHRSGVIHRDLKPANVLLDARGTVKVSDFGLAKLEHSLASIASRDGILGTPHYMSPEQAAGREIDARSDLFSVGSLAYELLTGTRPFDGPVTSAIYKIIYEAPPPPSSVDASLPAEVDAFVRRALEKSPDVRFATAEEMADALEGATLFLSRATTQEIDVPSALAGASAPLPPTLDLPAPGRGRRSPGTPRSPPRDLEQRLVLPGVVAVLAMGIAVLVMLWRQPSGALPGAPPGGVRPDASSSTARVFVDGAPAQGGRAPSGAETPSAVVTLLLPGGMVWRDRAAPPESASDLASRVATKARRVEGSVAEEAQVLGTVIEGARPLALVEVPEGRRWLEVGGTLGDGAVAAISSGDVAFRVPLASGGTAEVRRALRDVAGRGRSQIEVRTDPPGALVMLGDERHAVGYTPCAVAIPPAERVTIRLKGRNGREVVLPGLAVDRLAAMGEVRVAMP
jgi:hypothetical protein